ncbi:F0F1 ATP synthase subunit delta [Brachybacterium sp. AOP25-B2-12]|uniref:F0F1 ATP synthase subunit delta n=1 Tax=Brachybacterium sp. AOP25-B2-12 TaxID=3457710 RepID=UPI0040345923
MRGTSAASLHEVVRDAETSFRGSAVPLEQTADELFSVARAIDDSNQLIRLLSDGGRPADVKRAAAQELFGSRVSAPVLAIVLDVVAHRWSQQVDIIDALERLGFVALLTRAENEGHLERVEEELFQLSRLIETTPALSTVLDDARERPLERAAIINRLLVGKVDPVTLRLARQAVTRSEDVRPARRVLDLAEFASERRRRLLAVVSTARPLSPAQTERLSAVLTRIYGRAVQINSEITPDVVGGLRIQVGDDLFDATVLARLAKARERVAS